MRRRHWLAVVALAVAGCSSATTKKRGKAKAGASSGRARMNSGPQGFGDMLVPAYIEDLKNGSADKKIAAARELGNMGSGAKAALPLLEKLAGDKNRSVATAAKSAVTAIKKR